MSTYLPAIINIAAFVIGQMLVTRRHWTGFLVWAAANYLVAMTSITQNNASTGLMFMVYCSANVYSMWLWSRQSRSAN